MQIALHNLDKVPKSDYQKKKFQNPIWTISFSLSMAVSIHVPAVTFISNNISITFVAGEAAAQLGHVGRKSPARVMAILWLAAPGEDGRLDFYAFFFVFFLYRACLVSKKFPKYPLHRIFEYIHIALNVVRKNN